jgi:hypothetical protein
MRALFVLVTRWRGQLLLAFAAVIAVAMVTLLVRGGDDVAGASSILGPVLIAVLVLLALGALVGAGAMFAGVDPDARLIASRLTTGSEPRRLLARWLRRTRWARNVGGASGIAWWIFGTSAQGDLLVHAIVGIALGSMASQLHHVRPGTGPRTASLARRTVADYLPVTLARQMIVVASAAVLVAVVGLVTDGGIGAVPWAVAAMVVIGAAHLVQRRVASRSRPALPDPLERADDLARELAIGRGLAQPAVYCALALLAHGSGRLVPAVGGIATAVSVLAWLSALVLWWRNRGLGLDHLVDQPLEAGLATP